jgi:hypothetical protein
VEKGSVGLARWLQNQTANTCPPALVVVRGSHSRGGKGNAPSLLYITWENAFRGKKLAKKENGEKPLEIRQKKFATNGSIKKK